MNSVSAVRQNTTALQQVAFSAWTLILRIPQTYV